MRQEAGALSNVCVGAGTPAPLEDVTSAINGSGLDAASGARFAASTIE